MKKLVSIIVPLLNEESSLKIIFNELSIIRKELISKYNFELIFIDDGSVDNTLNILNSIAEENDFVKVLSFTRNFGHQSAILAGYEFAKGDFIISMDGDMQDPPSLIIDMLKKIENTDAEVVYAIREKRTSDMFFKKNSAKIFYKFFNYLSSESKLENVGDFRLITKKLLIKILELKEKEIFLRGMISWTGFKSEKVFYDRPKRISGETKFTNKKMIDLALNGLIQFSSKPLELTFLIGVFMALFSFLSGLIVLFIKIFTDIFVPGLASIILVIIFFCSIQIFLIGLIGIYLSKIFNQVKKRPRFLIKTKINLD